MGPMKQLLGMLPGVGSMMKDVEVDEKQLDHLEAIVRSMTPIEREEVKLLNKSRIKRVSKGSGTQPADVNRLLKQFDMIQKMTKQMSGMGAMGKMKAMQEMSEMDPSMVPGMKGMPRLGGKGSTKVRSRKTGAKRRKRR